MINEMELTLQHPLTTDDWNKLLDVNMDDIPSVQFQTPNGKTVEYVKVIRCQDCKHHGCCGYYDVEDWFCADGERKNGA